MSSPPPGCMGTRQQVCVERQVESRKDIAAAVAYLIPNNANDVFEDGKHVGIVANLAAYVVVIALFEVVQKFEQHAVGKHCVDKAVEAVAPFALYYTLHFARPGGFYSVVGAELAAQAVIGNGIAGNYVAQRTILVQHGAARERYVPQSVGTERHEAFGKQRQLGFAVGKHYSVGYVEVTAVEVAVIVKRGLGLEQMHKAEECFPELPLVLTIQYGNVFQRVQRVFAYGAFRIGVEEVAFPPGAYIYFPACLEQCDERIGIIAPQVLQCKEQGIIRFVVPRAFAVYAHLAHQLFRHRTRQELVKCLPVIVHTHERVDNDRIDGYFAATEPFYPFRYLPHAGRGRNKRQQAGEFLACKVSQLVEHQRKNGVWPYRRAFYRCICL